MLQTNQARAGENSLSGEVNANEDGSTDLYFAPKAPKGERIKWLQTIPGKSWHVLWRIYGPTQIWYDQKWKISEIELVK